MPLHSNCHCFSMYNLAVHSVKVHKLIHHLPDSQSSRLPPDKAGKLYCVCLGPLTCPGTYIPLHHHDLKLQVKLVLLGCNPYYFTPPSESQQVAPLNTQVG